MILYASLVLGLGLARTMLIFEKIKRIIFAKIFDFNFRTGVRARGVANFTGVAASGGGVHPCLLHYPCDSNKLGLCKTATSDRLAISFIVMVV